MFAGACVFVCFRVCLLFLLAIAADASSIAAGTIRSHIFFPPELLPRLASRGIIEVERKGNVCPNIFDRSSMQSCSTYHWCTFMAPHLFSLPPFLSQCTWAVWANSGTPWRLRSTMQGLSGSRTATSVQEEPRAHALCKQAVWPGRRLNWDLKATSSLGARCLQTEIAVQLEPQSDLNRGCTVFTNKTCG